MDFHINSNLPSSFNILDYPVADKKEVKKEIKEFNDRNAIFLDPKNNSPFGTIFEKLRTNTERLAELNERYKSLRNKIRNDPHRACKNL